VFEIHCHRKKCAYRTVITDVGTQGKLHNHSQSDLFFAKGLYYDTVSITEVIRSMGIVNDESRSEHGRGITWHFPGRTAEKEKPV
jgi:hypothetical protein